MKVINTSCAPAAIGPYSQAITAGGLLFVSGQLPINPATGTIDAPDGVGQLHQCMKKSQTPARASFCPVFHPCSFASNAAYRNASGQGLNGCNGETALYHLRNIEPPH